MAIAMTCNLCKGRVYLGCPDPEHWDYVPLRYCPHPGAPPGWIVAFFETNMPCTEAIL